MDEEPRIAHEFMPYHRGAVPDSRDVPNIWDEAYAFNCPKCDFSHVHVIAIRMVEGPYDGRPCAEIALDCEAGCQTTLRFANYKGMGYCHWIQGCEWVNPADLDNGEWSSWANSDITSDQDLEPEVHTIPVSTLRENLGSDRNPTVRQVRYLCALCERKGISEADLILLGVDHGRLHGLRAGLMTLDNLTFPEVGGTVCIQGMAEHPTIHYFAIKSFLISPIDWRWELG